MTNVKPSARKKARRFALQALYQWQLAKTSPSEIIIQFRVDNDMKKVDIDYFEELVTKIPANVTELDESYSKLIDRRLDELDQIEKIILRMASYEFMHRIDVPYRVVINEAIELAKTFGADDSHKYVNGVLDKVALRLRAVEMRAERNK